MDVEVERSPACPCHRCGDFLVLAAQVRRGWINSMGVLVSGVRTVPLCGTCDQDKPAAHRLVLFWRQHATLTDRYLEECGRLLTEWLAEIAPAEIDDEELAVAFAD